MAQQEPRYWLMKSEPLLRIKNGVTLQAHLSIHFTTECHPQEKGLDFYQGHKFKKLLIKSPAKKIISQSKVVGILVEEALAARGIFDPSIGQSFQANPNWKAQAQSLMKKDTTEAPLPKVLNKEAEMMEQFREFQQFKKMMSK